MTDSDSLHELNEEQIARYLRNHPGFFLEHDDLLSELELTQDNGNTVSLVERQVGILRDRNVDMRNRLTKLIENARKNDQLFDKTKQLVLKFLECRSIDEICQCYINSLLNDFNVAYSNVILFELPVKHTRSVPIETAHQHIPAIMRNNKGVCGVLREEELQFLFNDNSKAIGSAAVVPLEFQRQLGLIAIGSPDPDYFDSSMGTLFLNYISAAMSRMIDLYK